MSKSTVSAAVLVSAGRHPVSGIARACRGDAVAFELGRRLAGDGLMALHVGEPAEPALQDYLALGATRIEVLQVAEGQTIVAPLANCLRDVDVIITGSRAEIGAGSGMLPYALAHALSRPLISNVLEARIDNGEVEIRQFLPKGKRRNIAAPLPVILVAHPLAPVELRYAHARRLAGRIAAGATCAASLPKTANHWQVEQVRRRPVRLKAEDKKAGHARLLSAIGAETKAGVVAIEGSSVDKAQVILSYLREHRLVDF